MGLFLPFRFTTQSRGKIFGMKSGSLDTFVAH
jgi:hypothetical protein